MTNHSDPIQSSPKRPRFYSGEIGVMVRRTRTLFISHTFPSNHTLRPQHARESCHRFENFWKRDT